MVQIQEMPILEESSNMSPDKSVIQKKQKPLLIPVLLLSVVVVGAVFAGIQIGKRQKTQTLSEILFNQPTIQATPTTDSTEGWKTYINTKYGFEFKYPENWEFAESKSKYQNTIDSLMVTLAKKENMMPLPVGGLPHITIDIVETTDTKDFSFHEWTRVSGTKLIGGINAELREHISVDSKEAVFTKDGKTFEIISQSYDQDSLQNEIFDQILSTFKFLD